MLSPDRQPDVNCVLNSNPTIDTIVQEKHKRTSG